MLLVEQADDLENTGSTSTQVDKVSNASEFYGPSGTFYFLSKLRSQVSTSHEPNHQRPATHTTVSGESVADLLHSSDYGSLYLSTSNQSQPAATDSTPPGGPRPGHSPSARGANTTGGSSALVEFEIQIHRECIRLYFENLHCVHPILDQESFLEKCERDIWHRKNLTAKSPTSAQGKVSRGFLALFNIVLAIGAITAGETSLLNWDRTLSFVECNGGEASFDNPPPYTPTRVARLYFERAKVLTGDLFESSSFEIAQTLFLMVRAVPHATDMMMLITTGCVLSKCSEASQLLYVQWYGITHSFRNRYFDDEAKCLTRRKTFMVV